jgi:epoxyqueuosine reductase
LKSATLPDNLAAKANNWVFGCDICQDVCPWNRFSKPHNHPELAPKNEIISFSLNDWMSLDESSFKKIFKESPLSRTKWKGIQRNLKLFAE